MEDAIVGLLVDKLTSAFTEKLVEEVSLIVTFKNEFQSICDEVVYIKFLLIDAGNKTKSQSMATWLRKLRDFLNEAMDLIEDCDKEADIVCVPIFRRQMGSRIKELKKKINEINYTGTKYLTYLTSFVDVNASSEEKRRRQSCSGLPKKAHTVRSIEEEIDVITKKILDKNGPRVIAVVGTGGQGKTRTVQHVFNNIEVKEHFKHRIWLPVSRKVDIEDVLHDIAHQIQLPGNEVTVQLPGDDHAKLTIQLPKDYHNRQSVVSMEGLRDRIRRHLQGERKQYLFVLDDVWHADVLQWLGLALENENDQTNVKILVTTCDKAVSNAIANYTRQIQYLSDEERLELFCFHADLPDNKLSKDLECLRTQILEKCTKLPTAVEEIATSMAEVTRTPTHWKEALRRLDKAAIINKHVTPTLRSSYNALPYNLQACFLYFASFPSDTEINSEYLVYAWLASFREFVSRGAQAQAAQAHAVDVAWTFIEKLVDRCVIQASRVSGNERVKRCVMQDFFHILALSESEKEAKCILKHGEALDEFPFQECKGARRISLINTSISRINGVLECPRLRILLLRDNKLEEISESFFNKLNNLAVLDLSRTKIKSLPRSIGNLKSVKFLNLSETNIKKLPKSLSGLRNLQFLDVNRCEHLCRLHSGIGQHKSLLHLNVKGCKKLESLPSGISKLCSLRTLKLKGVAFNMKPAANAFRWGHLQHFSATFNDESISQISSWSHIWSHVTDLRALSLQYDDSLRPRSPLKVESEIVGDSCPIPEGLSLMKSLEILRLSKFRVLVTRPEWIFVLHNLMVLVLHGDDSSSADDYIGLESIINLRKLRLSSNQKCKGFPKEFGEPNAFPKLKELIIEDFNCLETFPLLQDNAMPMLKSLRIILCSQIRDVPEGVEGLKSLEELELDASLRENIRPQILNSSRVKVKFKEPTPETDKCPSDSSQTNNSCCQCVGDFASNIGCGQCLAKFSRIH